MELAITFHEPVSSKDGQALGVAQRLYHSTDDQDKLETQPYERHLKLFDFNTGDDLYIPVEYLARAADGALIVDLTFRDVQDRTLSRQPRYVAYHAYEELPLHTAAA